LKAFQLRRKAAARSVKNGGTHTTSVADRDPPEVAYEPSEENRLTRT
jgi:hypothetical protein